MEVLYMRQLGSIFLKRLSSAILSLLFAFGLLGAANIAAGNTRAPAPSRDSGNYQAWLSNQIRHRLVMLPFYSVFDNLEYRMDGNSVTLTGQVVRPNLKDDAEKAVKRIEGVQSVSNQIEVLPLSPFDDQIRRAEFRSIYGAPGMDVYVIRSVQ